MIETHDDQGNRLPRATRNTDEWDRWDFDVDVGLDSRVQQAHVQDTLNFAFNHTLAGFQDRDASARLNVVMWLCCGCRHTHQR